MRLSLLCAALLLPLPASAIEKCTLNGKTLYTNKTCESLGAQRVTSIGPPTPPQVIVGWPFTEIQKAALDKIKDIKAGKYDNVRP